jgi:hypothetical protein
MTLLAPRDLWPQDAEAAAETAKAWLGPINVKITKKD